jgi:hypothetical protein
MSVLLRRFAPILIGAVGLVFLIIGIVQLASQGWVATTGTVGACTTRIDHTGTTRRMVEVCDVTWTADGRTQTLPITVNNGTVTGDTIDLRVSGTTVVVATPRWIGGAMTALGLILDAVAITMLVRSRRQPRSPAAVVSR